MASAKVLLGAMTAVLFTGGAAAGDGGVWITPRTVRPGQLVSISAGTCAAPATAYSAAFGSTSARLREQADLMRGAVRISPHAAPGTYAVTVRCVRGGPYNGTFVVDDLHPTTAPDTGGGGLAMTVSGGATRTAWLFGALAMVVTVLGTGLALTRGRGGRSDH
ncbi:hypothetical protein [Streptosporangium sp. NPDC051022]|uniref:hypothetical protein n=1 Tax=Streptosporangium sp. NPDC051022 TaxID=3155752 RepID=UPI003420C650